MNNCIGYGQNFDWISLNPTSVDVDNLIIEQFSLLICFPWDLNFKNLQWLTKYSKVFQKYFYIEKVMICRYLRKLRFVIVSQISQPGNEECAWK